MVATSLPGWATTSLWDLRFSQVCSPLKINWRFGRTCLHFNVWSVSQARTEGKAENKKSLNFNVQHGTVFACCALHVGFLLVLLFNRKQENLEFQRATRHCICLLYASCWFLVGLALQPCWWRWNISPKRWLAFNGLQGVTFRKIERSLVLWVSPYG
jgi:hypothetical protein